MTEQTTWTHPSVIYEIEKEMDKAESRYGPFRSTHEGLGVLTEEVAELLAAIRGDDLESVRTEAIQVAAVAARIAQSIDNADTRKRSTP